MGSLPFQTSLDFRPKTITDFLNEISTMEIDVSEKASKLDGFVKRLEEEMKKIDAFKRELPFCMLLLTDAIVALKESSMQCGALDVKPVLEEFISLNKETDDDDDDDDTDENVNEKEEDCKDKKEWMSSVQLWKADDCQSAQIKAKRNEGRAYLAAEDRFQSWRSKNEEKKLVALKSYSAFPAMVAAAKKQEKNEVPICALSLVTPSMKSPREELNNSSILRSSGNKATSTSAAKLQPNVRTVLPSQQPARKQRRCWSPELHRRFVSALQQLGGPQVATPKQIRELMQVDGLTNDEVKSHLQKYRLHTRRVPATAASADQSTIVLGDLWMSQDGFGESSKVSSSQSASPQGPLQLAGNGGYSTTGGDSVEDEEDVKSESYSYWKTHVHPAKDDA